MSLASMWAPVRPSPALLTALALSVLLHGAWWFMLGRTWAPSAADPVAPPSPRLVYVRPGHDAVAEVRRLGSPMMFSLPHPGGFSGERAVSPSVPSAVRGQSTSTRWMEWDATRSAGVDYQGALTQTMARVPTRRTFTPVAPVFRPAVGATGFVLRILWPDGEPGVRTGLPGAGVLAGVLQDRPWELAALLEFDARGGVQHVFIEKPTPSRERNEAVARALRAVRIEPGADERRTRVLVQYDQQVGARPPPGGGARP
jgi:hypothetical protein